jgi:hypothetical protein
MDLLKYVRDSQHLAITYGGLYGSTPNLIQVYADADFSKKPHVRKSRSGHVLFLNGGAITWKSSLQKRIAMSTSESELYAMYGAVKQAMWFKYFLGELGYHQNAIPCFEDNSGLLDWIRNPKVSTNMMHIPIEYYWLRDTNEAGDCVYIKIDTSLQKADIMTKQMDFGIFDIQVHMLFNLT